MMATSLLQGNKWLLELKINLLIFTKTMAGFPQDKDSWYHDEMRYRPWRGPTIRSCKLNMEYSEECIIKSHYCTYMYYFLLWISDTEEKSIRIWKIEPVWMSNIWNSFKYLSFQRSQRKISNYLRKQIDPRIGKRRGLCRRMNFWG